MILGVDPGLTGALACVSDDGRLLWAYDMPVVDKDVSSTLLCELLKSKGITLAVVERVSSMPGQGVHSVFKFGKGYGQVLGVLSALAIPVVDPTPTQWKREMCLSKDKELSRDMAIKTWPSRAPLFARKKDNGRAEAALLALWYIRKNNPSAMQNPISLAGAYQQAVESTGRVLSRRS